MDNLNPDYLNMLDKTSEYVIPTLILLAAPIAFIAGVVFYDINKTRILNLFYKIKQNKDDKHEDNLNSIDKLL